MHSTTCGIGASSSNSTATSMQSADGLKMGLGNNDDAMNKIPLKSVTDDEEKNGGEFIHDTATAEEARREQRRVKLLNLMKKLTIGIICFIGIALISYVIISLCFSEWPKSTSTNPNKHHNNKNSNITTATITSTFPTTTTTIMTSTTTTNNPSNYAPTASPLLSLPSTFKSSFLSDDNNNVSSVLASSSSSPTNATLDASNPHDEEVILNINETLTTATAAVTTTKASDTLGSSTSSTKASFSSSTPEPLSIDNKSTEIPLFRDIPMTNKNFTSTLGVFQHAAVCSDRHVCSQIGSTILHDGGSAVDAAIATLFCSGITIPQSMGIGGGMLMNVYKKNLKQAFSVDAREIAPYAATQDMFVENSNLSINGALAIAVPGELMGYQKAYEKFGKLPWRKLIEPSLKLCKEGFYMSHHHISSYTTKFKKMEADELLSKVFINNATQQLHAVGTKLYPLPQLCNTYEILADKGAYDFYNGTLAKLVAEDLKDLGSMVTSDDLESYMADFGSSISMQLGDDTLYVVQPVSSGAVVANILSILEGFNITQADLQDVEHQANVMHRMVEAMKFGFAKRWELGDIRFNDVRELISRITNPETGIQLRKQINDTTVLDNIHDYGAQFSGEDDFGTSAHVIMAPNGDAVAVTSTINDYFGSGKVGKRTGIVFNSAMDDFSTPGKKNYFNLPPSPGNFIEPQKRPMSSMSPIIVADPKSNVRMAISSAGGAKIISSIVDVMTRVLWMNQNIKEAIDAPRFHTQLVPNTFEYQESAYFSKELLKLLEDKGHKLSRMPFSSVVCAIVKNSTAIYANSDYRKQGGVAGY